MLIIDKAKHRLANRLFEQRFSCTAVNAAIDQLVGVVLLLADQYWSDCDGCGNRLSSTGRSSV